MASAIILLHGSGDSGDGIREWTAHASKQDMPRRLQAAGVRIVAPDAPAIPYTLIGGSPQSVWFDRTAMAYSAPEDGQGIARSLEQVDAEIDKLVSSGIQLDRIGVVGMSMGGCLALHVAYGAGRHAGKLAFAASLSTFLPEDSQLDGIAAKRFKSADASPAPPLFMAHGTSDGMINIAWAEKTLGRLEAAGVPIPSKLLRFEGLGHDMCQDELAQLTNFILDKLQSKN
eukprot:TRINITY_DN55449_c0_g1_i1.p1 TRINITY_DN55449_c0_g1~~TRINITY_DN55449_c0_g1_i1.p1  ORF type:complete len:229 (-),score=44.03 TRINITY_DN55449_c0_g1_i1:132-818(-)